MKTQPTSPLKTPEPSSNLPTPTMAGPCNTPATAPEPPRHRDYDGRGLGIGPLDHLAPTVNNERFAIR
ncbi:MAG TPA: hypothetical protein VFW82_05915 [Dyella sp.]|nr:hypothetical protein [Dyella sp.]